MNFDFKKYKRFFAFGCSFTNNSWPTWANLIAKETVNAKFYNFGMSGAGNIFISNRISEMNNRFKFCETDLVMVMWSTFVREDRFIDRWESHGSIFCADFYDNSFKKKYFDYKGYVIRDLALIDLTYNYLNSLPCDSYQMLTTTPSKDEYSGTDKDNKFINEEILPVYQNLLDKFKITYYEHYPWNEEIRTDSGHYDTHPSPMIAYNFLLRHGFTLSDETYQYAKTSTDFLFSYNRPTTIDQYFLNINPMSANLKSFPNKFGL
jgi:hypothetical protein